MMDHETWLEKILGAIRDLADAAYQERVWVRGEGPEADSSTEALNRLFDDYDFERFLSECSRKRSLPKDQLEALRRFASAADAYLSRDDDRVDDTSRIATPEWQAIRAAAQRALEPFGAMDRTGASDVLHHAQQICSKLVDDTQRAIMLREMHARAVYESDIIDAFGASFEIWGVKCIINALQFEFIITLMRMYDEAENTASLVHLMRCLDDDRFGMQLREEKVRRFGPMYDSENLKRRFPPKNIRHISQDRAEEKLLKARRLLASAQTKWSTLKNSHLLASLKQYRNKILAHNALDLIELRGSRKARHGDADELLDTTMTIVEMTSIAVTDHQPNFTDDVNAWRTRAEDFWLYAAHIRQKPKGRSQKRGQP